MCLGKNFLLMYIDDKPLTQVMEQSARPVKYKVEMTDQPLH